MIVVDIGNSDAVFGVFDHRQLTKTMRIATLKEADAHYFKERFTNFLLENDLKPEVYQTIVWSSVVPELNDAFDQFLKSLGPKELIKVTSNIHEKIKVLTEHPEQLGTDLYSNAVFAYLDCNSACLIIDFGTALTITAVTGKGEICGVSIAPGLKTAVDALFGKTSQLPQVPLEIPKSVLGKNTVEAIQSGIMIGYEGMVRFMISAFKKELGESAKVYATGGLSPRMINLHEVFDHIDINLTLKGLQLIGEDYK